MRILRRQVLERTGGKCAYCGTPLKGTRWQRDHIAPLVRFKNVRYSFSGVTGCKYPQNHQIENVVAACRACNKAKSNLDLETWRGCFEPGHVFYFEKRPGD